MPQWGSLSEMEDRLRTRLLVGAMASDKPDSFEKLHTHTQKKSLLLREFLARDDERFRFWKIEIFLDFGKCKSASRYILSNNRNRQGAGLPSFCCICTVCRMATLTLTGLGLE